MENINKDNFFNEVENKFPVAFKMFSAWFNDFKDSSRWMSSNVGNYIQNRPPDLFYALPYLMQIGIIVKFIDDNNDIDPYHQYYQEWYTSELLDISAIINHFHGFLQFLDERKNPDHRLTNPKPELEDDLPF